MIKRMTIGRGHHVEHAVVDDATADLLKNAAGKILASCTSEAAADAAYRLLSGQAEKIRVRRV